MATKNRMGVADSRARSLGILIWNMGRVDRPALSFEK